MVLPRGKYDFDTYPLTEELIEINDRGHDVRKEVYIDGVIEVADEDLALVRITKCFDDDLETLIDMSPAEIAAEDQRRAQSDTFGQLEKLHTALAALDYLTNKRVEGELDDAAWQCVVDERNDLRCRIRSLRALTEG
jgi:hypothetical protein